MKKFKLLSLLFLICFVLFISSCNKKEEIFSYSNITKYNYLDDSLSYSGIEINGINEKEKKDVVIPEEIKGEKVVSIADEAFKNCFKLKSIFIPDTVISIGKEAFINDINLEKVTLPNNSATIIHSAAFKNCTCLKGNEKDNGIYIGNDSNPYLCLVKMKENKNYFKIDDDCKIVLNDAFKDSNLDYLVINESLEQIGYCAFGYSYTKDYYSNGLKVYYCGIEESMFDINKQFSYAFGYWNKKLQPTAYYFTLEKDKETKDGYYWYYDNDNKIVEKVNIEE